jgi:cytoskeletal protein CcmA (bactofilin family)
MWNRRNDESPQQTPEPRPVAAQPQPTPVSPPSGTSSYSSTPKRISTIGPSVIVKGEIHTKEELVVDGELEGTLESSDRLTVGNSGKVRAQVKAREVTVRGSVKGNVHATDRITIHKDANLVGDVKTAGIVIEDGAYFKGSIDILRVEAPKQEAPSKHEGPRVVQTPEVVSANSNR